MMKNIKKIAFALLVSASMMFTSVQASDAPTGITFDGDAGNFITTTDTTASFMDMMPGEERIQTMTLTNNDYDSMKFFVKVDDATLLNEEGNGNIVYDIDFKNDGNSFYSGRIGGASKVSKGNLTENYLLKTLKKGESTNIDMAIKIDGTSMNNEYQGTSGNLNIVFSVEHAETDKVVELIQNIPVVNMIPGVNTGDATNVYLILGAAFLSCLTIIIIIIKRRKDEENEKA